MSPSSTSPAAVAPVTARSRLQRLLLWWLALALAAGLAGCARTDLVDSMPPPSLRLGPARHVPGPPVHAAPRLAQPSTYKSHTPHTRETAELRTRVVEQIQHYYYRDVPESVYGKHSVDEVLDQLDPYTRHIRSDELAEVRKVTVGCFAGIGVQVAMVDGRPVVISPLVDSPAYRAGVASGDRILAIDGVTTAGMTLERAVRRMMGPVGSTVHLTVDRPGRRVERHVYVRRETIKIRTVLGEHRAADDRWEHLIDSGSRIGYVRITTFTDETPADLQAVLRALRRRRARGLVLDLRSNPGGVLQAGVAVADCFLRRGVIVTVRGRDGDNQTYRATRGGAWTDLPLVVLVNQYSASASEIVAAALQDHGRAVLVGERTYGKGSVQRFVTLGDGKGVLKVTTANYYTPRGRTFDHDGGDSAGGIKPDLHVRLTDQQVRRLASWRRDRDTVGRPPAPGAWRKTDTQLVRAVGVLRSRLCLAR